MRIQLHIQLLAKLVVFHEIFVFCVIIFYLLFFKTDNHLNFKLQFAVAVKHFIFYSKKM